MNAFFASSSHFPLSASFFSIVNTSDFLFQRFKLQDGSARIRDGAGRPLLRANAYNTHVDLFIIIIDN